MSEWRPIHGWEGRYEVSSEGLVRNTRTGRILKPYMTLSGYLLVKLHKGNVGKNYKVHRLVASVFIRRPMPGEQVNHIDFDRANNSLSNLEWVSPLENARHSIEAGRSWGCRPGQKRRMPNYSARKLTMAQAEAIRDEHRRGASKKALSRKYGIGNTTVRELIKGNTYRHESSYLGLAS